ncbi:MAG TPA: type I methionyl aminopeptidase [Kiritimatiellia bacterium]|jgi:methionyl aminopeptidase|nr:type I methionyl aminopeptidase [Kiritimatiellia bacterium]OQC60683.1 MAG: Methionine aminopeptidase 1 [Verrucomicrobia bacterium ADurb.Bin018]HOE00346.1 type I methionyl aminopeptidase [Kiritimatiellia bacterium]HOE36833.1 type I methionyl aminopeptidase [Kiritimatiellia bacterium]HOR73383.1 type I methionyl aminopeptidase [Kiritimatiellia bacterium]
MIPIKTRAELASMRVACRLSAQVLAEMAAQVVPGITTGELDEFAARRMRELGVKSAFFGYGGFPGHTCISLNDEVVHGIPGRRVINAGDLVSVDLGIVAEGFIGDNAITVRVGAVDEESDRLCRVGEAALAAGIAAAQAGNRVGDIGHAVQAVTEAAGFSVVRDFCGHGVGRKLHEDPQIPNYGEPGRGPRLQPGMTLAIEPMINSGTWQVEVLPNRWTVRTRDRRRSAHYEHTVLVVEQGPAEILTCVAAK